MGALLALLCLLLALAVSRSPELRRGQFEY